MTQDDWISIVRMLEDWGFKVETVDQETGRIVMRVPDQGEGR